MITQGNELQERRDRFRVSIRRDEIKRFVQQKRFVIQTLLSKEQLDLLIQNLGAQPQSIKMLARNKDLINKEHLIQDYLLYEMSQLDAQYNKHIMKILVCLIKNEELSLLILSEEDLKHHLQQILIKLVNTVKKQHEDQFWSLIEIMISDPKLTKEFGKGVFILLIGHITTKSKITLQQVNILELILPRYMSSSKQLFDIIRENFSHFFRVLQDILEKAQNRKLIAKILVILQFFIRMIESQEDLYLIVNENFILQIQGLMNESWYEQVEAICLMNIIIDTKMFNKFIINNCGKELLDQLTNIIQSCEQDELLLITFNSIKRLKILMNKIQFPNETLDDILKTMLDNYNIYAKELALEFLIEENYQIEKFEYELVGLLYQENQRIYQLSLGLLYSMIE